MEENREYKEAERKYQEVYDKLYIDLPKRTADLTEKGASKEEFDALAKERLELEEELVKYSDEMSRIASQMIDTKDTVSFKFLNNENIDNLVERLDRAVENGEISREHADRLFEEVGEKLHLQEVERLNELREERNRLEGYVSDNRDERDLLANEDSAKEENLQGHNNAISQLEERIAEIDREMEDLEELIKSAPESVEVSAPKEENAVKLDTRVDKLVKRRQIFEELKTKGDDEKLAALEDLDAYGLSSTYQVRVIDLIESQDLLKDIVRDHDKYNLSPAAIVRLCRKINDDDFKKEVIDNNKEYKLTRSTEIAQIARHIENEAYREEIARDWKKYEFMPNDISSIIDNEELIEAIDEEMDDYYGQKDTEEEIEELEDTSELTQEETDSLTEDTEEEKTDLDENEDVVENGRVELDRGTYALDSGTKYMSEDEVKKRIIDEVVTRHPEYKDFRDELDVEYGHDANDFDGTQTATYIIYRGKDKKDENKKSVTTEKVREEIATGTYALDSVAWYMSEEEIKKRILDEVVTRHPEYEDIKDELEVEYEQNVDDFDGTQTATYRVYRVREVEKEEVFTTEKVREEIDNGTYALDSVAWYMSEEEIKKRILDEVVTRHPEYEDIKDELEVEYEQNVDDFDGTQTATYRVYRVKEVEKANDSSIDANDLQQELEETYGETLNELNNLLAQNKEEIEKLERELAEIKQDDSKKAKKERIARDSAIAEKNTRIANLNGENNKLERKIAEIEEKISLTKETNEKKDEYVEELTKESDYQEPSLEERISNIEKTLAEIAAKVSELKEEFDKNKQEIADLDEKSKNAVDDKEIAETNTQIANLRGRNNNIAREIKDAETKVESLTEERENLQTEKMAKEELTPEEYEEIFGTLKNKDITRKILKEKGIYDIYRKRVEDRTPEEVAKLKATFAVIIDEIANAKLKNRDSSIMDLVQVIYNFDDKVTLEEPAKEEKMTNSEVTALVLAAGKEPAKIQGSSKNSAHEAAPEDMQDAMESSLRGRGLEEVVHIFEDDDGKKYVRDVNLNRLRIEDPVRTYIANENGLTEIDGNEADDIRGQKLIEISEDDVKRIEENANNELSPYRVEHTDISQLTNAASNNSDSDNDSEPSEENTSDDEYDYEEVFSGVYPMDNIPGISSLDEDAQIEAVNNAMIDWAILQNPELKNYDRSELVVVPGAQAEDVADGNDYGETQVTPFKIMRKIKKEKDKTDIPEPPVGDDDTQNKDDDPTPKPPVGDDDNTPTPPGDDDQNDDDKNNTNDKDKYLYVKRIISELKAKTYEETDDKYKTKNDVKTYQASQLKVWEAFKRELTTGRVEYNVVGIGKAVLTLVGGSATKFISKYVKARSAQRGKELSDRFDELWKNLPPEERMVVYEKYKGGIMQEFGVNYTDFNRLILPKMREIGMNKVRAYNDELGINYQMLIATKKAVDEIDERINSNEIDPNEREMLLAQRKELVHQGGELALRIRDLQELAASELSSGIHGIEEDFKAQQSKMIYVGFRWAKNQSLSDEDEQELIGITQKFEDSVNKMNASGDDQSYEDVMNSFLDEDKFFLDHTSIRKSILGEQSVGETYFTTYAKMFNYNGDPFVRNLLLTASMAMATYGAINAVRTHVMETRDFNEALAQHNKMLNQKEATIQKHGQDILDQRGAIENAEKFRTRGGANDLATTYEVRGLDKTAPGKGGWNISDPAYTPRDKTYHADYNGVNDYINTEFTDIARRKASGAIDADQALQEVFQVSENVTDKFLELARAYLPELQKYAKNHPQHDRQAMLDSLEYMINNANAVKDGHAAIETINGIAVELTKFQLDSFEGVVPSDLASTLAALGTGMALCGRIAKETRDSMNPNNHKKYGDSIVDELRSYFYGDEAEDQELEEMMDDENEDENENENENSRSR